MTTLYKDFKNILKYIFPMPARSQNREFNSIRANIQKRDILIDSSSEKIDKLQIKLESQQQSVELLKKELKQLQNNLSSVHDKLSSIDNNIQKKVLWANGWERNFIKLNWGDVTSEKDFAEKFIKLTKGLDAQSVQAIIRILSRQKDYLSNDEKKLDLFTRAEQEELRLLEENFYSEILKLAENIFAYRNYLLPIQAFDPSVFYYKHGMEKVETINHVKGNTIIDVGGFIGDSVLVFQELCPEKIHTFEASPGNFQLLKQTLKLNDIKNTMAENVAIGDKKGKYTLHVAGANSTSIDRLGFPYSEDIEVPVIALDDYVKEYKIENIALIKIDIEGGEPNFLIGAKNTICTQKPILLLSIYHNAHDFFELKPLLESWNLGYKFKIHKPTLYNSMGEILLLAEIV